MNTHTVALRRFRMADAFKTAPVELGVWGLLARLADTWTDGLYGCERFDAVIAGDDPVVSLCAAAKLQSEGKRVLLAPDALSQESWPAEDWGLNMLAIQNHFDGPAAEELARQLPTFTGGDSLREALKDLISRCAESGRVLLLVGDFLHSCSGIRGAGRARMFFPLHQDYQHAPKLNPLWQMVSRQLPRLRFNRREIEFVEARQLIYTSPLSSFIDPALGTAVGQARQVKPVPLDQGGRADDVKSAFEIRGQ